jgi:AGZA family xanthine/uracil permease-like MFS transporter
MAKPKPQPTSFLSWLERRFALRAQGTDLRRETLAGVTTFVTMAYIVVVNPAILSFAGLPIGASTVATILTAAFGTLAMGWFANRPIAVAPYMGENAFIAFGLAALGIGWQQRLGAVFLAGLLFLAITLLGVRTWLAGAISPSLRASFAVGIGLFLALIGLYESGVVTSFVAGMPASSLLAGDGATLRVPDVPLKLGDLTATPTLLAVGGFVLIAVLLARRVRGALLLGMAATAVAGALLGLGAAPKAWFALPFQGESSLAPIAFQLDIVGMLEPRLLPVLLTLFLMGFLDTLGTLLGLDAVTRGGAGRAEKAASGKVAKPEGAASAGKARAASGAGDHGVAPADDEAARNLTRPMLVDAAACMFGGLVGTSTSGAYIESAAGIREGGRTGLAAVVTGLLFLACLFFVPLVAPLQAMRFVYAPALVAVGLLMVSAVRDIDFGEASEAVPALVAVLMTVFTYNIANGLTAGLVLYPAMKLATGRRAEVRPGAWVLAAMGLAYLLFGIPH